MDAIVNKANKVVGLIKRTVGSKNMEIFSMLYEVLCLTNPRIRMPGMSGILSKISWQSKNYNEEHRESLSIKNYARCHMKNDVCIAKLEHNSASKRTPSNKA